ncbi:MAG: hypothetical protein HN416_15650 [Nitrospina sp.]|nr:hypothetical protein [Nitrospina sp.]
MRKSLVYFCTFMMAFMFVSCQTLPKAPEASKPGKPSAPGALNLNGKWNGTAEWKTESESGTSHEQYEIVQEGMEITILNITTGSEGLPKGYGTLEGNILHMESSIFYNSRGSRISYPARELFISQDGNTITTKFDGLWQGEEGWEGPVSVKATITRE